MNSELQKQRSTGGNIHGVKIDTNNIVPVDPAQESVTSIEPPPLPRGRHDTPSKDVSFQITNEARDLCISLARRASNAFKEACIATSDDEGDCAFGSCKQLLEELWEYAYLRDVPFRDLLGLLDAALKRSSLVELQNDQRDVLRQAFCDLPLWTLDISTVDGHIRRFADHAVDIAGPLRPTMGTRFRLKIEVIPE